jgi:hypothetical protein
MVPAGSLICNDVSVPPVGPVLAIGETGPLKNDFDALILVLDRESRAARYAFEVRIMLEEVEESGQCGRGQLDWLAGSESCHGNSP